MKKTLLIFLLTTLLCSCSLFEKQTDKTASELITEARTEFNDENYLDAIELFQNLKNWYPFSEYVKEAEIKISDSFFELEKYDEAIRAYQTYERLHPKDADAQKAAFRIGESYYKQILSFDRDQSNTNKALQSFMRFMKNYPGSKYQAEASLYIEDCINKIAESDLNVANFYFKQESYDASKARLEDIIKKYPNTKAAMEAVKLIGVIDNMPGKDQKK